MKTEDGASGSNRIVAEIREYVIAGIKEFLSEYGLPESEIELGFDESVKLISNYISFCENKLRKICEKHSRSQLLYSLSFYEETWLKPLYDSWRLQHPDDIAFDAHEEIQMKSEAYLTAKLASLKFSTDTGWAQQKYKNSSKLGGLISREQLVGSQDQELDIKRIVFWSTHHIEAQYGYRTIQRISIHDKAVKLIYNPLEYIGTPFAVFKVDDKNAAITASDNMHFYFQRGLAEDNNPAHLRFNLIDNYEPFTFPLYSHKARRFLYFDLSRSFEYYRLIREPIEEQFGSTLEEMYAFLATLGEHVAKYVDSLSSGFFIGVYCTIKRDLIDVLAKNIGEYYKCIVDGAPSKPGNFNWRRRVHLLMNRFTMSPRDMKNINLWMAKPLLPLQDIEMNFVSCDLSSILFEYLYHVCWDAEVGKDEVDKDIKGANFEEYMDNLIARYCQVRSLGVRSKVKDAETGHLVTDIDLSYKIGKFLFIVECKARTVNQRFFRGDAVVAFSRWNDVCEWIGRLDEICEGLSQGKLTSPIIQKAKNLGATYIVPIVCVLSCQYLLDYGDNMTLSESGFVRKYIPIPRVCAPHELIFFFRSIDHKVLLKKPFVLEIN
jgi:hypothetical protein